LKILYFDIDGTVLRAGSSRVKPVLGDGAFGAVLDLCRGAFADPTWFRAATDLVADGSGMLRWLDEVVWVGVGSERAAGPQ